MSASFESSSALAVGQTRTATITDIAFGGEGVTRIDGVVVFVPFVLAGEDVEIEVTGVKRNFARARLVKLLKSSPHRAAPRCRYFGDCGGCQYQHIDYPTQIELKYKQVVDVFERIGGFHGSIVRPVVPCESPYGYRNRIMIRSQWDKTKQGLNIGFIRCDNRLVVDIEECSIAEPALNVEIRRVRANPPPKGGLKVVLRVPPEGWDVPRDSFFQNNFFLLPALVQHVRGLIRSRGARHLVDAYCGVGFFAVELADLVESFAGIEIDRMAARAAKHNAGRRDRTNGEFLDGNVSEHLPNLLARWSPGATAVIVDPPRTGCSTETIALLREQRPAQVIYVSCHPATLARDLNALCRDGVYELMSVTPFDMFPQTQHIECVADLRAGLRG